MALLLRSAIFLHESSVTVWAAALTAHTDASRVMYSLVRINYSLYSEYIFIYT